MFKKQAMLKSSYYLLHSEVDGLIHKFQETRSDTMLLTGSLEPSVIKSWRDFGVPKTAIYYEGNHYVPVFNLNDKKMAAVVRKLGFSETTATFQSVVSVRKLLPNAYVPFHLAQGDCGPDAVRMAYMVLEAYSRWDSFKTGDTEKYKRLQAQEIFNDETPTVGQTEAEKAR